MRKFSINISDDCSYTGLKDYVYRSIVEWIDTGKADRIDFNDGLAACKCVTTIMYTDRKTYFDKDVVESVLALLDMDKDLMALVSRWTPYFSGMNKTMTEMIWHILYYKVFIEHYGTFRDIWRERMEK